MTRAVPPNAITKFELSTPSSVYSSAVSGVHHELRTIVEYIDTQRRSTGGSDGGKMQTTARPRMPNVRCSQDTSKRPERRSTGPILGTRLDRSSRPKSGIGEHPFPWCAVRLASLHRHGLSYRASALAPLSAPPRKVLTKVLSNLYLGASRWSYPQVTCRRSLISCGRTLGRDSRREGVEVSSSPPSRTM